MQAQGDKQDKTHILMDDHASTAVEGIFVCPKVSSSTHILVELVSSLRNCSTTKKTEQRSMEKGIACVRGDAEVNECHHKIVCKAMAKCWQEQTQGLLDNLQSKILEELLHHPTFFYDKGSEELFSQIFVIPWQR